jgi:hypothetical protein
MFNPELFAELSTYELVPLPVDVDAEAMMCGLELALEERVERKGGGGRFRNVPSHPIHRMTARAQQATPDEFKAASDWLINTPAAAGLATDVKLEVCAHHLCSAGKLI